MLERIFCVGGQSSVYKVDLITFRLKVHYLKQTKGRESCGTKAHWTHQYNDHHTHPFPVANKLGSLWSSVLIAPTLAW